MKTRSAKQKGKRLQNKVVEMLITYFGFTSDDVRSVPASVRGEDIILTERARKRVPFSIECKNTERINIWKAIEQARKNAKKKIQWAVVFSKNYETPVIALDFSAFLEILSEKYGQND